MLAPAPDDPQGVVGTPLVLGLVRAKGRLDRGGLATPFSPCLWKCVAGSSDPSSRARTRQLADRRGAKSLIREVRFRVFECLESLHDTVAETVEQLEPDLHATLNHGAAELAKDVALSLGGPSQTIRSARFGDYHILAPHTERPGTIPG
jgi:hypothetical protein